MRRFFILFITLSFVIISIQGRASNTGEKSELQKSSQIEKTLQKERLEAREVQQKEMKLLSDLEQLDRRLEKEQNLAQKIALQISASKEKSDKLSLEIEKLTSRLQNRKKLLVKRLSAIYKFSRIGILATVFSSESFPNLLMKYKYFSMAARYDAELIGGYQADFNLLEQQKQNLSQEIELKNKFLEQNRVRLNSFNEAKKQKQSLLHNVRIEKTTHMQSIKELEKAHEELTRMMASLQLDEKKTLPPPVSATIPRDRTTDGSSLQMVSIVLYKGRLGAPVKGKIIGRFGKKRHPKFNTVTFQKGIDIAASLGSEVKSIYNGKVVYSGWFPGYGKMIIIDHGNNYYSVYAHSSELLKEVGDKVSAGDLIALVGETGSLKGPCLYFEIRHHGVPVDPLDWIRI